MSTASPAFAATVVRLALLAGALIATAAGAEPGLRQAPVRSASGADSAPYDGVVQAVRQTVLAAQVPGAVVALAVKAGDTVRAGQVLLRLDARAKAAREGVAIPAGLHAEIAALAARAT